MKEKREKVKFLEMKKNDVFEDRGLFFCSGSWELKMKIGKKEKFLGSGMGIFRIPGIVSW